MRASPPRGWLWLYLAYLAAVVLVTGAVVQSLRHDPPATVVTSGSAPVVPGTAPPPAVPIGGSATSP
jgi:hypothetical protein